jgi:phosphoglycerate dehydrogenase-like enzyme
MPHNSAIAVAVAPGDAAPPRCDAGLGEVIVTSDVAELSSALRSAEIVLAWDFRTTLLHDAWPADAAVRWIHTGSIGVDTVMFDAVVGGDVIVTHTRGVFEQPVAEYVLALMLLFAKDLRRTIALQELGSWHHRETEPLAGRRLLVVGAGGVGQATARLARAVGMDVALIGRTARGTSVHAIDELDELLPGADFLVLALPLTNATRGLFDAARLARLPPGARLINVGRGSLVDEPALVEALRTRRIRAAALDVFADEPPADSPLLRLPNVVLSPHVAGLSIRSVRAMAHLATASVIDVLRGRAPAHLANPEVLEHAAFGGVRG